MLARVAAATFLCRISFAERLACAQHRADGIGKPVPGWRAIRQREQERNGEIGLELGIECAVSASTINNALPAIAACMLGAVEESAVRSPVDQAISFCPQATLSSRWS